MKKIKYSSKCILQSIIVLDTKQTDGPLMVNINIYRSRLSVKIGFRVEIFTLLVFFITINPGSVTF